MRIAATVLADSATTGVTRRWASRSWAGSQRSYGIKMLKAAMASAAWRAAARFNGGRPTADSGFAAVITAIKRQTMQ